MSTQPPQRSGVVTKLGHTSGKWQGRKFRCEGEMVWYEAGSGRQRGFSIDEESVVFPTVTNESIAEFPNAFAKGVTFGSVPEFALGVTGKDCLTNHRRTFVIAVESESVRNEWVRYFQFVINQGYPPHEDHNLPHPVVTVVKETGKTIGGFTMALANALENTS
eukprot:TRINITY_DN2093_c1_g1_i1.p1 TRINITY_DN2093_c1_g1~~TRINITY_DN2093_c1_g1_i1.p1  ORF type:complete len:163 (+),score=4.02 TRINITY_DN2093_c1_g1_i1:194-682(+)